MTIKQENEVKSTLTADTSTTKQDLIKKNLKNFSQISKKELTAST